jgi:hypothetical protein
VKREGRRMCVRAHRGGNLAYRRAKPVFTEVFCAFSRTGRRVGSVPRGVPEARQGVMEGVAGTCWRRAAEGVPLACQGVPELGCWRAHEREQVFGEETFSPAEGYFECASVDKAVFTEVICAF